MHQQLGKIVPLFPNYGGNNTRECGLHLLPFLHVIFGDELLGYVKCLKKKPNPNQTKAVVIGAGFSFLNLFQNH